MPIDHKLSRFHDRMASRIELWPLQKLRPYERNPRTHSADQVQQIAASIAEFGFNNPILVDNADGIVAGHGRLMAAQQLGLDKVPVVVLDHLTDVQRRAYVLADNKLAEQAGWDEDLLAGELAALQDEDFDLSKIGFSDEELADLLDSWEEPEALTDADEVPELTERVISKEGDLWLLGLHRLLCADATDPAALSRLMGGVKAQMIFTDPPYGIDLANLKIAGTREIQNDNLSQPEHQDFCRQWLAGIRQFCDGCIYVCGPPGPVGRVMFGMLDRDLHPSTTIIWNKDQFTLGRGKYQNKHEQIWFGWNGTGGGFTADRTLSNVWDFARPRRSDLHPTMKPVALVEHALSHASGRGGIVLDLFGGSGTTLIACERMGRIGRMMEIDPHYVDVIVRRWQEHTGQQATLENNGRTFAEIAAERLQ